PYIRALRLAHAGRPVTLYEAAKHAGGRCHSFVDETLDATIDNGTHLMLSGNDEVMDYVRLAGSSDELMIQDRARFEFLDGQSGERCAVDLGKGRGKLSLAAALMHADNRPPGVSAATLWADMRALKNATEQTVGECLKASTAYTVFWEPLCLGVLNAHPDVGAASVLWAALERTVMKGGAFARPVLTRQGLGAALVEPAVASLRAKGADVRFGARVKGLDLQGHRVAGLIFAGGAEVLGEGDQVVLAVPHFAARELIADLSVPEQSGAILNVHFKLAHSVGEAVMIGLVNADSHWVQARGAVASVTISAAEDWMELDGETIATRLWPDVRRALDIDGEKPAHRVVKERRATFLATPEALGQRPGTKTAYDNLVLAGDWTQTHLPATIEGALTSGRLAAEALA
ncbi:hydroxysqualene dehydroxylase HpnE, partial [Pseudomonadota bacterium]